MSYIKKIIKLAIHIINKIIYYRKKYGILKTIKKCVKVFPKKFSNFIKLIKSSNVIKKRYGIWIKNNEPNKYELNEQKKHKFNNNPKISIVVPMYNTDKNMLKEMVRSVQQQTYSNWELCIADGSPKINNMLQKISENDTRIKYNFLNENKGISGNSNEALKMAEGQYVALLDHDDTLAPFALYEVVKCINENPSVEFIYSDEDMLSRMFGTRGYPAFKPDFSIDFLRTCNYICHFSVLKKELMDSLEGFRSEYDGSQDHDLVLRVSEKTNKIEHISKILYHWRTVTTSFSNNTKTRMKAWEAGRKAVQDHLNRIGITATVEKGKIFGRYKINYKIFGNPLVTILIPNKDEVQTLNRCIESILEKTSYKNYKIVIIENNSKNKETFDYYDKIKENKNIEIIEYKEKGFNYSKIINFGVKNTTGEYILQLNNDIEVISPNWIESMLQYIQRKDVGVVGAQLYYYDNTIQHAGVIVGIGGTAGHLYVGSAKGRGEANELKNLSAVTGACLLSKRSIYEEVNFMTEEFEVALNDIDFCLKVREKGYLVVYNPYTELYHYESKSRGKEDTIEKKERYSKECKRFASRWEDILKYGDPYYNINFSLDTCNPTVTIKKINYDRG